ncbi:regulator of G-protein signaling protein-like [Pyxicephalus adspersus]|uniref:regulator of G-protein signaling protein-like n=1 Tax=Pyxicephalus adspersus TaxID=30357 RepID=UPI003B5B8D16
MCDAVEALALYGMCRLNSEAILREKVNIILKLFLACDTPPKLRINISDSQCDLIQDMAMRGAAYRSMFHSALITLFPTVIFFWKRFCTVKAMCGFRCKQTQKSNTSHSLPREGYHRIQSHYDYPILRFTLSKGIQLLLPNVPEKRYKAESSDHLSPWKQHTPPTSLSLTPYSMRKCHPILHLHSARRERKKMAALGEFSDHQMKKEWMD